jgi:hypothetical protein
MSFEEGHPTPRVPYSDILRFVQYPTSQKLNTAIPRSELFLEGPQSDLESQGGFKFCAMSFRACGPPTHHLLHTPSLLFSPLLVASKLPYTLEGEYCLISVTFCLCSLGHRRWISPPISSPAIHLNKRLQPEYTDQVPGQIDQCRRIVNVENTFILISDHLLSSPFISLSGHC